MFLVIYTTEEKETTFTEGTYRTSPKSETKVESKVVHKTFTTLYEAEVFAMQVHGKVYY